MSGETLGRNPKEIEIAQRLKVQWFQLVQEAGGNVQTIDQEFGKMAREYQTGDGRAYHNLVHIGKVDEVLNRYKHLARNFIALKFAGDGHDVVYVPNSPTNEADSADYIRRVMNALGLPQETTAETERLILLTKDHKTTPDDTDGKLMIDADFAIFAASPSEYDAYAQGIWNEYVGSGRVAEADFRRGRSGLISGWLGQDSLFLTPEIRDEMQPLAVTNLQRELGRLAA